MPDRLEQSRRRVRQSQLIPTSLPAVDGDEINFPMRIYPQRNVVRQMFARRQIHPADLTERSRWNNLGFETVESDFSSLRREEFAAKTRLMKMTVI